MDLTAGRGEIHLAPEHTVFREKTKACRKRVLIPAIRLKRRQAPAFLLCALLCSGAKLLAELSYQDDSPVSDPALMSGERK